MTEYHSVNVRLSDFVSGYQVIITLRLSSDAIGTDETNFSL